MGTLNLSLSSRVYIDTAIFIYTVENNPGYWSILEPLWLLFQEGEIELISSELVLLEVLVRPFKINDTNLIADYEELLLSTGISLFSITQPILREAARLRATTNLRTPDAIHAATALTTNCNFFLTNDKGFRNVPNLPIIILSEVLAS